MTVFKSHNSETKISENNEKRTGASFHEDKHYIKKIIEIPQKVFELSYDVWTDSGIP